MTVDRSIERISVWILPDQLIADHPALTRSEQEVGRDNVRVVLVESQAGKQRLPYHKKRQVLILSAGRHYAQELRAQGYVVDIFQGQETRDALARHLRTRRTSRVVTMAATEHAVRHWQQETMSGELGLPCEVLPNSMFLVERFNPIPDPQPDRRYVMEYFYRAMRKQFELLMEPNSQPTGGTWNFDKQNRKPLPADLSLPELPSFLPDEITRSTMKAVEKADWGVGSVEGFDLAVTRAHAEKAFMDFLAHRLPNFGPYEDAMTHRSGTLFHSMLSLYMNLGLLEPLTMARAAEAEYRSGRAPLNSVEGFVRQIVGWREFIYWQYQRQMPALRKANNWSANRSLPRLLWDGETDMTCLRSVVGRLIGTGFTHHIERLMVICNFCLMAGVDPEAVADWFLTFYVDSHDWVVLPNVIGMGLNADNGRTATKPYIASAKYIDRMSDYCGNCRYRIEVRAAKDACPFNTLYWNFLIQHEDALRANPRLGPAVLGLKRISADERKAITAAGRAFLDALEPYHA